MITQEMIDDRNCWKNIDANQVDWTYISINQQLSEDFIREFQNEVDWYCISSHQKLSEYFIREFQNEVDWYCISSHQKLSEYFIREFQDKVNWIYISIYQKLSEDFIRESQDKVDWDYISTYQQLSEEFIREFKDKVDWEWISKYQQLSEEFIREFKDKLNLDYISQYQKLSDSFFEEFGLTKSENNWLYATFEEFGLTKPKNNWLYATNEEKRERIKEKYELDGDYVIAYKSTRIDGHSVYNFRYRYEVGKTYESHCDYNLFNDNSFGLSAWTKEGALGYYPKGKLFKVRIHLNDLGAIVYGNKLRASKIEILSAII